MNASRTGRRVVLTLAAVVVFLVVAAAAPASPGNGADRVPVGNTPGDVGPQACGFPIHVGIVSDREYYIHETTLADGTLIQQVTGTLVLSFTNTDTGKTITENVSGPGSFTTYPDGGFLVDAQGLSFFFFGPIGQANTGEPGFVITSGHAVAFFDPVTGAADSFTLTGRQTNGCTLLS
jgi:hypothetical protein